MTETCRHYRPGLQRLVPEHGVLGYHLEYLPDSELCTRCVRNTCDGTDQDCDRYEV